MKRLIPFAAALLLLVGFAVSAHAADPKPFHVHFVVVPATLENGLSSGGAVTLFKKQVLELAGGFTELGATRGGSLENDGVKQRENLSFIIGADRDISKELKKMSITFFGGDGAFILAWPGTVTF